MKRLAALLLATVLSVSLLCVFAYAAEPAQLYAEDTYVQPAGKAVIPVKLKGNSGIMGFKVTVTYPAELSSPKASRGALTSTGNFNDSITQATQGSFDIVWNSTGDVTGDGTLFILEFNIAEQAPEQLTVELSYSQPDTFDEQWNDVVLACGELKVITVSPAPESTAVTEKENTITFTDYITQIKNSADSAYLKASIEKAAQGAQITGFNNAEAAQISEFLLLLNGELKLYGVNTPGVEPLPSPDEFKEQINKLYYDCVKESFIYSASLSADSAVIESAVKDALGELGIDSAADAPDPKTDELFERVISSLQANGAQTGGLPSDLTPAQKRELLNELYAKALNDTSGQTQVAPYNTVPSGDESDAVPGGSGSNKLIITVTIITLLCVTAAAVFIIKRKTRKKAQ